MFLDEVQTYDGASSGNLAALLEQTAKYGVRATLLNQNPERLTSATLNALTTNRSHLITTALNAHAAALIAREWDVDPPASAITGLPRWTFIAQATHNGKLTRPFLFGNVAVDRLFADVYQPERVPRSSPAIDVASGRAGAQETITALDTLDQRIRAHLTSKAAGAGRPSSRAPERSALPRLPDRGHGMSAGRLRRRAAALPGVAADVLAEPPPAPVLTAQPGPRAAHARRIAAMDADASSPSSHRARPRRPRHRAARPCTLVPHRPRR